MTSTVKSHWGLKKKKKRYCTKTIKFLFFVNESPSVWLNYFQLLGNTKWPALKGRPASSCTYHTVKSHPVPGRHVTFKNATVNDSTVHDGPLNEKEDILYTFIILLPAVFQSCTLSFLLHPHICLQPFSVCISPKEHLWSCRQGKNVDAIGKYKGTQLFSSSLFFFFALHLQSRRKVYPELNYSNCFSPYKNWLLPKLQSHLQLEKFWMFKSNICTKWSNWQQRQYLTSQAPLTAKPYWKS